MSHNTFTAAQREVRAGLERFDESMARAVAAIRDAATDATVRTVKRLARLYERRTHLARVLLNKPLVPPEQKALILSLDSDDIIRRLRAAINSERRRAIAGHWTHDRNRLLALKGAYVGERLYRLRARQRLARLRARFAATT